jgi:hypothetical protein
MYFITVNRVKQGPINEAEVRAMIVCGQVQPSDLCWREGWAEWRTIPAAFPDLAQGTPPPLLGREPGAYTGTRENCGLAIVSLVCGICTIVIFPLFFVFMIPAIICGHVAQSRIKQAKGALLGGGMALAGLIMGYMGVVMVPMGGLMAAMAIPAFSKVRTESLGKTMDNDARHIANAAQQYYMEQNVMSVTFSYDSASGAVGGPLANYVPRIAKGYTIVPKQLSWEGTFQLSLPNAGPPRTYNAEGKRLP